LKPQTRYAHCGDLSVAYQVLGDGDHEIVMSFGPAGAIEHLWDLPLAVRFFDHLSSFARVLLFDRRGTGASDPVPGPPTLEQQAEDMLTVMDAATFEQPYVIGETNAAQMAALFAATYPDRLSGLILYSAWAVGSDVLTPALREFLEAAVDETWGEGNTGLIFAPSLMDDRAFMEWMGLAERHAASPGMVKKIIEMQANVDLRALLPAIRVPTLVLHRRDDPLVDVELGRQVATAIPGARFVELPGEDSFSYVGETEPLLDEIEQFVTGRRRHHEVDRVLTTILFTDIVGSTQRAAELGDRRWRDLLDVHYQRVRDQVERFRGAEIRTLGDGFLATFDGPARAIRCGCEISNSLEELGVKTRIGLHTGEVEILDGDLAGLAVHIGARVATSAVPGEVLVSSTVKDLVVGSGLHFVDRGIHRLKGVPGEWHLFAVDR
jgi:class 3 adenylate cyclase/alpha-beta hydrolase superfamily lysophospholipase